MKPVRVEGHLEPTLDWWRAKALSSAGLRRLLAVLTVENLKVDIPPPKIDTVCLADALPWQETVAPSTRASTRHGRTKGSSLGSRRSNTSATKDRVNLGLLVGRIRVVGLPPDGDRRVDPPRPLEAGQELARFEMGSTIVLVAPPGGPTPLDSLKPGQTLRLGQVIGHFA